MGETGGNGPWRGTWWEPFALEEEKFLEETDDLGDIPQAEISFMSIYGYLPGAPHWDKPLSDEDGQG